MSNSTEKSIEARPGSALALQCTLRSTAGIDSISRREVVSALVSVSVPTQQSEYLAAASPHRARTAQVRSPSRRPISVAGLAVTGSAVDRRLPRPQAQRSITLVTHTLCAASCWIRPATDRDDDKRIRGRGDVGRQMTGMVSAQSWAINAGSRSCYSHHQ